MSCADWSRAESDVVVAQNVFFFLAHARNVNGSGHKLIFPMSFFLFCPQTKTNKMFVKKLCLFTR